MADAKRAFEDILKGAKAGAGDEELKELCAKFWGEAMLTAAEHQAETARPEKDDDGGE